MNRERQSRWLAGSNPKNLRNSNGYFWSRFGIPSVKKKETPPQIMAEAGIEYSPGAGLLRVTGCRLRRCRGWGIVTVAGRHAEGQCGKSREGDALYDLHYVFSLASFPS